LIWQEEKLDHGYSENLLARKRKSMHRDTERERERERDRERGNSVICSDLSIYQQ
jgi:hypothetical protein